MKVNPENILHFFFPFAIVFFIFFTFYNLSWGSPFFFHPDERNIAYSVAQLNFVKELNPHFFAYGSLPIYSVYLVGVLINLISHQPSFFNVTFENAIIIGRYISALLTLFTIALIYKVTLEIAGKKEAMLAAIISATSVAFLQFSHFSTFEMWISFFSLLSTYFFYLFTERKRIHFFIFGSAVLGVLCSLKLSSVVFFAIPLFVIYLEMKRKFNMGLLTKLIFLMFFFSVILYIITSPFNLLDSKGFSDSMNYESKVALGSLAVFYTGSFFNTVPVVFQYSKILPFTINPLITILSIPMIFWFAAKVFKRDGGRLSIFFLSFLILFLSGSFVFAKWTRYIIPSLPYLYILLPIFTFEVVKKRVSNKFFTFLILSIVVTGFIFSTAFVKTVRISQDTRTQALSFAKTNIKASSRILSEVYDLGIMPFNNNFPNITLENTYDLEISGDSTLDSILKGSEYIILPSPRALKSRTTNPGIFPKGNNFYSKLFKEKLGYKKIYETPCDIFCKITYLGDPINLEETTSVFDRPTVFIFKK